MKRKNMPSNKNQKRRLALINIEKQLSLKGYTDSISNKFITNTDATIARLNKEIEIVKNKIDKFI